jgi:hypothetical protein
MRKTAGGGRRGTAVGGCCEPSLVTLRYAGDTGVAAEVDSREWHFSPDGWERTMLRHARMTAAGVLVLHFSPRQVRTALGEVVAATAAALRAGRPIPGIMARPASGDDLRAAG